MGSPAVYGGEDVTLLGSMNSETKQQTTQATIFSQGENPAVYGGREALKKDSLGDEEEQTQSNCLGG